VCSWRTTIAGATAILIACMGVAIALLNGTPWNVAVTSALGVIVAGCGLVLAKDHGD